MQGSLCCGYGADGMDNEVGYDCVIIPGASKAALPVNTPVPSAICGNGVGLVTKTDNIAKTICSKCCPLKFGLRPMFYTSFEENVLLATLFLPTSL